MKVAYLVDLPHERVQEFDMLIEDALNNLGGRLIYRIQSRSPIRLVAVSDYEDFTNSTKYPPDHDPHGNPNRGVSHATGKGNGRRWMDSLCHSSGGSVRGACGFVPDIRSGGKRLRQCHGGKSPCHGASDASAVPSRGGYPPSDCVRVDAREASPLGLTPSLNDSPPTNHETLGENPLNLW